MENQESPKRTLELPDGRLLSYSTVNLGSEPGSGATEAEHCLLYLHGFPGCRLEAEMVGRAALEQGLRESLESQGIGQTAVVSIDRPGFGGSSPRGSRWSLLDVASDVMCLVDALGIKVFSVMGISGGGPHALAVGAHCQVLEPHLTTTDCCASHQPKGGEGRSCLHAGEDGGGLLAPLSVDWDSVPLS